MKQLCYLFPGEDGICRPEPSLRGKHLRAVRRVSKNGIEVSWLKGFKSVIRQNVLSSFYRLIEVAEERKLLSSMLAGQIPPTFKECSLYEKGYSIDQEYVAIMKQLWLEPGML